MWQEETEGEDIGQWWTTGWKSEVVIGSWFECPDQWEIWADKVATACHHPYLPPSLRALGQDIQNPACSPGTAPQFLVGVVKVNYEWDGKKGEKIFPQKRDQ